MLKVNKKHLRKMLKILTELVNNVIIIVNFYKKFNGDNYGTY